MKHSVIRLFATLISLLIIGVSGIYAQVHSPTSAHTSYDSISMTGYQGWFGTPGDGGTNSWRHYSSGGGFRPGQASIEYWPDMREADEDEKYLTEFTFDDGTPATVFSSVNPKTVNRHFQWMKEYGIDGAFVQRFRNDFGIQDVLTQVMSNALQGAIDHDRAISVMYDISGTNIFVNGSDEATVNATRTAIVNEIFDDWVQLIDNLQLTTRGDDQPYLYHNGKPLVALWGLGFPSRHNPQGVDMDFWVELVDKFLNDPDHGGCSILLGVPTRWRTGGGDALSGTEHDRMIDLIQQADVVLPWHTSRFGRGDFPVEYKNLVEADKIWCDNEGLAYAPTISPGIREKILNMNDYERPRDGGLYFWDMARAALNGGTQTFYLGMFDEVDEGTQYFKINNNPPFYGVDPDFTDYGDDPEDHYLWLAGEATRALKGEYTIETTWRTRSDDEDFQSEISIVDNGTDYEISLGNPAPGRKVYYAAPYKVPDGAPTVGVQPDTCLFQEELTGAVVTFTEEQRGQYIRLVEVDETTNAVIAYRAIVAAHGFAGIPYTTGFEEGLDRKFWTITTENAAGVVATTTDYEPNSGDQHLVFTTDESGTSAVNQADLHLDISDISTDIILDFAAKTLGSATGADDGIYFSNDDGVTFSQVHDFMDVTNTYTDFSLNVNDLAEDAGLVFSEKFVIRFQHRASGLTTEAGLVIDDISIQFSTENSGFAQFFATDNETQGAWMGRYGVEGDYIVSKEPNLPDYASISWDPDSEVVVWEDESNDVSGLQYTDNLTVLAARTTTESDQNPWSFTIDVGEEESTVFAYFLDGDDAGRSFILNVVDAATGARYDVQTVQDYSEGKWIGWNLRGEVTFVMEQLTGPNATVSGFFFAPTSPGEIEVANYLTFDGLDDYVDCGRETAVQLSGSELTLEAWFKLDSSEVEIFQSTILAMDHSESGNDQGYFLRANGDGQIQWGFGDGQWHEVESEAGVQLFEVGTWNHVAGVYDGNVQKIFLNGNLITTSEPFTATVGVAPTENLYLGSSPAFDDRVVTGGLAEVRIWNVARTDIEINEFATQRISGNETGLAAYWPIDEGEGQFITDLSQNALVGVLGNTEDEDERDPIWTEGDLGPDLVDALEGFNGSFEEDLMFWRFFEVPNSLGSTVEIITGDVIDGAKAAKVTFVEADETLVDRSLDSWDSNMPLTAGVEYFGSFWAKSDDFNNGVLRVTHGYFDADRGVVGEEEQTYSLTDTYQEYEFSFIPPPGTEKGWISFRFKNADNSEFRAGVIYLDHIRLLTPDMTTSVDDPFVISRDQTVLRSVYPNPFSTFTTINLHIPDESPVSLGLFDYSGRQVASLMQRSMPAGTHEIRWEAPALPAGTYFLVLRTNTAIRTRKLILFGQ